ncbi:MAG: hypothetical protein R3193_19360 [Marinobacter sp.]|nr:hypothetical protein [Marinobacter sp.]
MKDTKLALFIAAILIMLAAITREDPAASEESTAAVVPITYADKRGADRWQPSMRQRFMEDPANRIRMASAAIAERNGRGPDEWLPSTGQCDYMGRFMAVMERYQLHHREPGWREWRNKRQRCYTQFQ